MQAGEKVKALKCLIRSGNTDKIIFFAGVSRNAEIYTLAANYLQTLDWHSRPELTQSIVTFYTKVRVHRSFLVQSGRMLSLATTGAAVVSQQLAYMTKCYVHVMSCHVMSCHVMSCHVMSCHVMSCHVMSCHVMSCHVMSCHVMSCHVLSCYIASGMESARECIARLCV